MRTDFRHLLTLSIGILLLAGCSAKVGPKDGAVDQARKVAQLEREVDRLTIEIEEARADLEAAASAGLVEVDMAALPRPHAVVSANGSTVRRSDDAAELRWRIRSEDARGRFLQTSGPVLVEAVAIGDQGDAVELGRWEIDAARWREGLREGFMGTAYAIDVPLDDALPTNARSILARVSVSDVRLESPLRLETEIPIIDLDGREPEKR